ncbi:choice-of-anchor I domain-containing protein [Sediminispirochaeta smaragdinae]|uniref:choice-of-anchor I domain-containing protein n=1 Tax=Sediminispirochaeta smaragdinae TaxID=55206 RepID=UPI0038990136
MGALPDMVTFFPNGKYVLSANEGEPVEKYESDPAGSVSIIEVGYSSPADSVCTTLTFSESDSEKSKDGVPVRTHDYLGNFETDYSFDKDIESEYIAVDGTSQYAYVSSQENHAVAKIDIERKKILTLKSLGYKDYSQCGVDFVEDGKINIVSEPYYGLYMPDSLTTFEVDGKTYIATANEGDDRGETSNLSIRISEFLRTIA